MGRLEFPLSLSTKVNDAVPAKRLHWTIISKAVLDVIIADKGNIVISQQKGINNMEVVVLELLFITQFMCSEYNIVSGKCMIYAYQTTKNSICNLLRALSYRAYQAGASRFKMVCMLRV